MLNFQNHTLELANGVQMPIIGFGTWQIPLNEHFTSSVQTAIQIGYRHFDTAQIYNNAQLLGEAIRDSGVPRSEFFITMKLWTSHRSYECAIEGFEQILEQLQMEYVDLLLIHWPASQGEAVVWQAQNFGAWRALETIYAQKRARAIGLANFLPHHLVPLLTRASVAPMINQLESHPGYTQFRAVGFSLANRIPVQSWSPLGRGTLLRHPLMIEIAQAHGVTPAQVALRWSLQHGLCPIPKATELRHQQENLRIWHFELTPEEMKTLDTMPQTAFSGLHPDTVTF